MTQIKGRINPNMVGRVVKISEMPTITPPTITEEKIIIKKNKKSFVHKIISIFA